MMHEYEFEEIEIHAKDGRVYQLNGVMQFDLGNDSFDYDYGSISSTWVMDDHIEDYDLDGVEVTTWDDEDKEIIVPTNSIEGTLHEFITCKHADDIIESLKEY